MMLTHDNLEEYRDPINYDLEFGGESDKYAFFMRLAEQQSGPVLELACGTGLTALPIAAAGHEVTGMDLCPDMLAYAKHKAALAGLPTQFLQGDALNLNAVLGQKRYALIYLTGNAFQCFLNSSDQATLLQGIHAHLSEGGVFAFETRNPNSTDLSLVTEPEPWHTFTNHDGEVVSVSGTQHYDEQNNIMHWHTIRRWRDQERLTRVACKFTAPDALNALLTQNGFEIMAQYGDWQGQPFAPNSRLIISVCQLAA